MDFHLERGLRLHTEPEHKNLYNWAINEIDAKGQQIGHDQIPWDWTLHFTATSCVLCDSIDIKSQFQMEETTPRRPRSCSARSFAYNCVRAARGTMGLLSQTTFSMFGTDRAIKSFQLDIHPIADPAEQESCRAWGSVSYTAEIDFRNETTDDCIVFYLFVKPETFARYAAKIAHGLVDEMILSVGSVAGFYSEWSPSISTRNVKVLTGGSEQKITLPPGLSLNRRGWAMSATLSCTSIDASSSASGRRSPRLSRRRPMSKRSGRSQRRKLRRRWTRGCCRCWDH